MKTPQSTKGESFAHSIHNDIREIIESPHRNFVPHYYATPSKEFIADVLQKKTLKALLIEEYKKRHRGEYPKTALSDSWESSAFAIANILQDAQIMDAYVAMEYCFSPKEDPFAYPKRADFLLFGKDVFHQNHIVVIEAKRWECAEMEKSSILGNVRIKTNGDFREESHPSKQAEGYAINLIDLLSEHKKNESFAVSSFGYLHNMLSISQQKYDVLFGPKFSEVFASTPLYIAGERQYFIDDLHASLANGKGDSVWGEFNEILKR